MTHATLCSGIGAPELAAMWMNWTNLFNCEIDPFCRRVLKYYFPDAEQYEDIRQTDFIRWRGLVDVLTAGFPCQPFSLAGLRNGADDDRYLWPEVLRAIREIRPTWVVGENVAGILSMVQPGCEVEVESQATLFGEGYTETEEHRQYIVESICRDLEELGYSVQPFVIPACGVGAPHRRDRVWFVAHAQDNGCGEGCSERREVRERDIFSAEHKRGAVGRAVNRYNSERTSADTDCVKRSQRRMHSQGCEKAERYFGTCDSCADGRAWQNFPTQPPVRRGDDGLSDWLDFEAVFEGVPLEKRKRKKVSTRWATEAIKAHGNAIVPQAILEIYKAIELSSRQ